MYTAIMTLVRHNAFRSNLIGSLFSRSRSWLYLPRSFKSIEMGLGQITDSQIIDSQITANQITDSIKLPTINLPTVNLPTVLNYRQSNHRQKKKLPRKIFF